MDTHGYDSASHRLLSITGANPRSYSHDANGSVTQWGAYTLDYDTRQRLTGVSGPGLTASYAYDAQERRVQSTVNGVQTFYLYDTAGRLLVELDASLQPVREYLWLHGEPLALVDHTTAPGIHYYHNDHLGTPQRLTDAAQQVTWAASYTPFGRASVSTALIVQPLRFPGQYEDAGTGLHYNWHRYYEPETGRYLRSDPIGLDGGLGTYVYVDSNPLSFIDPLGLAEVIFWSPVGRGKSSFGHISAVVNGKNYSWNSTNEWDTTPSYIQDQAPFRPGIGVDLRMTAQQENLFEQCLNEHSGDYDALTNNCGTPIQKCLREVGIEDFFENGNTTLAINGNHVLPNDFLNGLLSSKSFESTNNYEQTSPTSLKDVLTRAPWAKGGFVYED